MRIVHDFKKNLYGIAIDSEDNIFVANFGNNSIDKISLNNGKVSITQSTKISSPLGLGINSKNEIYIGTDGEIKKMTKEGIISNIAGDGTLDGNGNNAKIGVVYGICFDENDITYFCDYYSNNHSIRKITPEGKVITVCGEKGNSDRKGKQAKFNDPLGIVYNHSSKIFYITDNMNKSICTMTVDGNVNTLCKYSDFLKAITIDGEGKLYVSTHKGNGEGEIITVDSKGEIKQMNISVKYCDGIAFNSKGDLFLISDKKLCVIRNCTKYPPHPLISLPHLITNSNTKAQPNSNQQSEIEELRKQLATTQSQLAHLSTSHKELEKQLTTIEVEKKKLTTEMQKLKNENQQLETQNKVQKIKLQKLEEKETKENEGKEVLEWLTSIKLSNLFPILQDIGAKDLEFLKLIEESDFEGTNIKPLEKRMLFQSIKKLE